jgi:hypothetical protein
VPKAIPAPRKSAYIPEPEEIRKAKIAALKALVK